MTLLDQAPSAGAAERPASSPAGLLSGLEPVALAAVRGAALGASAWAGRGDGKAADAAATDAMRAALGEAAGSGTVVIGEGEKDGAPMLYNGEVVGHGDGPDFDIAVDPLECTDLCAAGLEGSLTTIALAERGALWSPGPAHYMDKLVARSEARDAIDLDDEPERTIEKVAAALGREAGELQVMILDKPRHAELIDRVRAAGAKVLTPSAGDVAGAMLVMLPGTGVDLLMGIGGTPEGVMAACAVRALGGAMQGRLVPQRDEEAEAVQAAGLSTTQILHVDDLVRGPALFAAAGVTGGNLLRAPWHAGAMTLTECLVVRPGAMRWIVEATPDEVPE